MADDFLLKELGQAFTIFADEHLRPLLRDSKSMLLQKELATQLLLLQWRSRDAFRDFGEFYCIRLLLDEQSALASYFIDLFSQLYWMLIRISHRHCLMYDLVRRIANTCLLLYAADKTLPRQDLGRSSEDFKRVGRIGRMFSSNKLHCRMRQLGFVNLDQPGVSVVSLKEELGTGGFATVYKGVFEADHTVEKMIIGDPVAVKMFANDNNRSGTGISFGNQLLQSMEEVTHLFSTDKMLPECCEVVEDARLKIELGRLVSVRHPNIVTPRGYIGKRPQGESGLVMEVMDESLHDYLQKVEQGSVPPLAELDMLDLMFEIAKGMRFLHECNLMHRDLKPRNVLLRYLADQDLGRNRFEVKLADFGLTKLYSLAQDGVKEKHTHTAPVGTPCYMAPELRGNAQTKATYEEKVDIFSYGTTCFNILIGNPDAMAFAPSREGFYEAVKTGQWKQWVQGFDRNWSYMVKLVARCWETDPSMRPTFAALCLLLQHSLQHVLSTPLTGHYLRPLKDLERFQALAVKQYIHHCKSFLGNCQWHAIGLEVMGSILEKFEVSKQPLIRKKVDFSDYAKDVRMYLEALKSRAFEGLALAWPKIVTKKLLWSRMQALDFNFLESSDPLIFIKGLACHNMFSHIKAADVKAADEPFQTNNYFDFKSDEALSELQVDASLVPLLVGFWTLTIV